MQCRLLLIFFCLFVRSAAFAEINNGQYALKPLSRVDLRLEFQKGVLQVDADTTTFTVRFDQVRHLPYEWTVALRADLPYQSFTCTQQGNGCYNSQHIDDSLVEALFITPEYCRWAFGLGLRVILPTAGDNLEIGNGKYRAIPTAIVGYDLSDWNPGSNISLLVRQDKDFAGYKTAPPFNETYIQPALNWNLNERWFISFAPEMRYRWTTHTWFIPADIMVGVMLRKNVVASIEYDYGIVTDYPFYKHQVEFRIGFFI